MRTQKLLDRRNQAAIPAFLAVVVGLVAVLVPSQAMADGDSVVITSPADGGTITQSGDVSDPRLAEGAVVVTFTAAGAPTTCSLDGQVPAPCTSPVSLPGLSAGGHTITVAAGAATATSRFTVQTILLGPPPEYLPPTRMPVTARWGVARRHTFVRLLRLNHLPRRTHVWLACVGRGCPSRSTYTTTAHGTVDLTSFLHGRALRPRTRITVTLGYRNGSSTTYLYTTRRGARPRLATF